MGERSKKTKVSENFLMMQLSEKFVYCYGRGWCDSRAVPRNEPFLNSYLHLSSLDCSLQTKNKAKNEKIMHECYYGLVAVNAHFSLEKGLSSSVRRKKKKSFIPSVRKIPEEASVNALVCKSESFLVLRCFHVDCDPFVCALREKIIKDKKKRE